MLRTLLASPLQQCKAIATSVQQLALLASAAADGAVPVCPSAPQQQLNDSSSHSRTTGGFGANIACRSYSSGAARQLAAVSGSSALGAYAVEIAVQAFEKRYVDMACNTIGDMVLLAFAPKSYGVLPVGSPAPSQLPVNLAFGAKRRDVRLPWRRTRFTLIRGPHIDKKGMEQFERREYKSILSASTNSADELQRLLEALKIYQFTGVQLKVQVRTAQQLQLPSDLASLGIRSAAATSIPADAAPATSREAGGIGSPVAVIPAPRSAESLFAEELDSVLRLLRPLVYQGLEQRRRQLGSEPEYQAWLRQQAAVPTPVALTHQQQQRGPAAAAGSSGGGGGAGAAEGATAVVEALETAAGGVAGGELYGKLLRVRLQQQLERQQQGGSPAGAAEGGGKGGDGAASGASDPRDGGAASYLQDARTAAELLARIDAELLHAHQAAMGGGELPSSSSSSSPSTAGAGARSAVSYSAPPTLDPATMSPAEYAHAVLQYVRYVDGLYGTAPAAPPPQGNGQAQAPALAGSSGAATMSAASSDADLLLQVQGPSLALRLLEMWWAATSAEFRQHLALPPVGAEGVLGAAILRRRQAEAAARAAAAAGGSGGAADGGAGRSGR